VNKRYGEAASLLLQLLNNEHQGSGGGGGGTFMSPNGTTRHELWLRFADVCTGHLNEAKVAGVDFDGIVRAVLKGQDVGNGGGGSGDKRLIIVLKHLVPKMIMGGVRGETIIIWVRWRVR